MYESACSYRGKNNSVSDSETYVRLKKRDYLRLKAYAKFAKSAFHKLKGMDNLQRMLFQTQLQLASDKKSHVDEFNRNKGIPQTRISTIDDDVQTDSSSNLNEATETKNVRCNIEAGTDQIENEILSTSLTYNVAIEKIANLEKILIAKQKVIDLLNEQIKLLSSGALRFHQKLMKFEPGMPQFSDAAVQQDNKLLARQDTPLDNLDLNTSDTENHDKSSRSSSASPRTIVEAEEMHSREENTSISPPLVSYGTGNSFKKANTSTLDPVLKMFAGQIDEELVSIHSWDNYVCPRCDREFDIVDQNKYEIHCQKCLDT